MRFDDISGKTFGRLTAVWPAGRKFKRMVVWLCMCECGKLVLGVGRTLRKGVTLSCGCLTREKLAVSSRAARLRHGEASPNTKEYRAWKAAKARCYDPKSAFYHRYGGRGISMCERWRHSFEAFLSDMGRKPSHDMSLDRINNEGNYEPGNCRWATAKQQANNKTQRCKAKA